MIDSIQQNIINASALFGGKSIIRPHLWYAQVPAPGNIYVIVIIIAIITFIIIINNMP